jgi:hypothetical protein
MALTDIQTRVLTALLNIQNGMGTADDRVIVDLYMETLKPTLGNARIGTIVMKEFDAGWFKGKVIEHDDAGFLVEYEDGDSEHMSAEELDEVLYTPEPDVNVCDAIEWIETSGNKAQSFSKICKKFVGQRPFLAQKLADIFLEIGEVDITEGEEFTICDIGPYMWSYMGDDEPQKFYWSKRVLEELVKFV